MNPQQKHRSRTFFAFLLLLGSLALITQANRLSLKLLKAGNLPVEKGLVAYYPLLNSVKATQGSTPTGLIYHNKQNYQSFGLRLEDKHGDYLEISNWFEQSYHKPEQTLLVWVMPEERSVIQPLIWDGNIEFKSEPRQSVWINTLKKIAHHSLSHHVHYDGNAQAGPQGRYYLAATISYETGQSALYVNGSLAEEHRSEPRPGTNSNHLYLGKGLAPFSQVKGIIGGFAIYERALTQEEIRWIFQTQVTDYFTLTALHRIYSLGLYLLAFLFVIAAAWLWIKRGGVAKIAAKWSQKETLDPAERASLENERYPEPVRPAPSLSVVFSFFNEENVLDELISRTRKTLKDEIAQGNLISYELVFVNDQSSDGSMAILKREAAAGQDIVIVDMSRNFGVSECVLAGFSQTTGDVVVYMDADLQDPPEVISRMIAKWRSREDLDVVYTTRITREGEHPLKMLITKFGYRFINRISDIYLPVDSGDFKLLTRRVVFEILKLHEQKPYIRGIVSWVGFKQEPVYYNRDARFDGRENTKFPVLSRRVIFGYLERAMISFSDIPLKASLFLGLFVSFGSFVYGIIVFVMKYLGLHEPGWPSLMAAIVFLGGIQLSVLGIIGLYISTIFLQVKGRPIYIIREVIRPVKPVLQSHPIKDSLTDIPG
ncbi:MAG: hypothetical protein A2527_12840 [Candidatus Lambdaproteobacteria bacterium RIFOXYD2_FULL_50_16]|uniref:Glycosyltransferase 2-like domain-containing protein n=1 Tax=Candidatus Lambdaproteobacteria bacterium RIFOXYD2_FULL_50_16 TaxID=1817772 RepID=A0A1F6G9N7_9PROT|nr:MAG: hypothetical protein A2527_12840 [Candidatus Lambdaproteobacteria bacterium RIFOXYD2_FULL_50_16]